MTDVMFVRKMPKPNVETSIELLSKEMIMSEQFNMFRQINISKNANKLEMTQREKDVAQREKDVAQRERDVAQQEKNVMILKRSLDELESEISRRETMILQDKSYNDLVREKNTCHEHDLEQREKCINDAWDMVKSPR